MSAVAYQVFPREKNARILRLCIDPDISPANAALQVVRVARGVTPADINALLERQIAGRSFGVFGEPRVNVLDLNLALQRTYPRSD